MRIPALIIVGCFIGLFHSLKGQSIDTIDQRQSLGSDFFKIRPKFFHINIRTLPAVQYFPYNEPSQPVKFEGNRLIDAELFLPVVLSKKTTILAQLRYKNESLNLGEIEGSFQRVVKFSNSGMSLYFKHSLGEYHFVAGHVSGALKSDQYQFNYLGSILDYNGSLVYGKNYDHGKYAFGMLLGNSLGRFRISPLFVLEHQFNNRWLLDAKLPKELSFTRIVKDDNFYVIGGLEAIGATYYLSKDIMNGVDGLEYRRTAIDLKLGVEKEIYDFLWFGVYGGLSQPLSSMLVHSGDPNSRRIHDFNVSVKPFLTFSIFAVPPRKLFQR